MTRPPAATSSSEYRVAGKEIRTQAERRAATRAELLAAAEELFAERGFSEASLGEIAGLAGVSKGALYHHFLSKDDCSSLSWKSVFRSGSTPALASPPSR
jgi:hypothetical protein